MYSVTLFPIQIYQVQKYLRDKDFECFNYEYVENESVPSTGEYTFGDFTIT